MTRALGARFLPGWVSASFSRMASNLSRPSLSMPPTIAT